MARSRGTQKVASARQRRQENLTSLSTEVLRLRLQAANLPITGSKAEMITRLTAAVQPRTSQPPSSGRVQKRTAKRKRTTATRPRRADPSNADRVLDDASDRTSSVGSVDGLEEDDVDLAPLALSSPQRAPTNSQPGPFTDAQMAAIQDTVRLSLEQAINSRSCPPVDPYSSPPTPITSSPASRRQGAATPLGLHRPLDRNLEDKILRGEYVDFTLLLPDSLSRPQVPEIQLRVDDSTPGSASPVSMVRKRKPVIDNFQKWLDAYTAYMLVLVASYPRRSLELLKYQQIISRAATKFKGLAFLAYDEQFRRRAAYDLSISWDQVDLELWTVTFSGLAKPHCLLCSSPYHSQTDCPSADPSRLPPRNGPVCFRFNRTSGCTASACPFPHVCRRCRSTTHSILNCPSSITRSPQRQFKSTSSSDRSKR